jgi:hypothetical protein
MLLCSECDLKLSECARDPCRHIAGQACRRPHGCKWSSAKHTLTKILNPNVQLEDGEEKNRQHPDTFQIPSDALKRSLRKGDHVKVIAHPERFWVEVLEARWPQFKGTVLNDLYFTQIHGIEHGDELSFEARHIVNVKTVEEQKLPKTNIMGEETAEVTVEMLGKERPRVPLARCVLNSETQIIFAPGDDSIMVSIFFRSYAL